jgi:hypothetical protein
VFKLNGEDIKKSPDFCYLGSVVAEDGGATADVNVRIQKATFLQIEKSVAIHIDRKGN